MTPMPARTGQGSTLTRTHGSQRQRFPHDTARANHCPRKHTYEEHQSAVTYQRTQTHAQAAPPDPRTPTRHPHDKNPGRRCPHDRLQKTHRPDSPCTREQVLRMRKPHIPHSRPQAQYALGHGAYNGPYRTKRY
jgi:hypothetical protein